MKTQTMCDVKLLARLLEATRAVPVDALGANPAAIESLRTGGCEIDVHPHEGVRLIRTGLGCWVDYIEGRHADRLGRRLFVYRATTSTQDAARSLLHREPASHIGHVITADHQTAGRGRLGRRWQAPPGAALMLTAIVDAARTSVDRLMLGACCAVAEAIEAVCEERMQVRWPNDVLLGDRKLAGILVEQCDAAALIGIGVNVTAAPRDLPATCLHDQGIAVDRLRLLDLLLDRLDFDVHHATDRQLQDAWRARSCLSGQRLTVESDGRRLTGRVIDIDPAAGLLMAVEHGPVVTLPAATTSIVHEPS
ncbi:MAG: biotin--[acetyl-CoA-carboxylase] ligase [Planctomycetes bacterium]|nr:biotin--[acetyl-CoA-carboxylase] ligase [Planctomycetota bacterium]